LKVDHSRTKKYVSPSVVDASPDDVQYDIVATIAVVAALGAAAVSKAKGESLSESCLSNVHGRVASRSWADT